MADRFVIDTVTFIHYLTDTLSEKLENVFKKAENGNLKLILPSISIGESIYVFKKQKKDANEEISGMFENLSKCAYIEVKDLDLQDWKNVAVSKIPELHDRMVAALAKKYKVPLITNDSEISKSGEVKTIWD